MNISGYILLTGLIATLYACGGGGGGSSDGNTDGNDDDSNNVVDSVDGTENAESFVGGGTNNAGGGFDLSGDDTSVYGTRLDAGAVGASLANSATGQPDYIIIVDEGKSVTDSMSIEFEGVEETINGFILVFSDASTAITDLEFISMTILKDGVEFDYTCIAPSEPPADCGGLEAVSLDIPSGTATLTNATVVNADSGTVLTLNGTVTWD